MKSLIVFVSLGVSMVMNVHTYIYAHFEHEALWFPSLNGLLWGALRDKCVPAKNYNFAGQCFHNFWQSVLYFLLEEK